MLIHLYIKTLLSNGPTYKSLIVILSHSTLLSTPKTSKLLSCLFSRKERLHCTALQRKIFFRNWIDLFFSHKFVNMGFQLKDLGLNRDSNPGPLAPKARIIPLDHWATLEIVKHEILITTCLSCSSYAKRKINCQSISKFSKVVSNNHSLIQLSNTNWHKYNKHKLIVLNKHFFFNWKNSNILIVLRFKYGEAPWRNGSASDSRSEGCVFKSRRGHTFLH